MKALIGRHELKYYINPIDQATLRARLKVLAKPDEHIGESGGYMIRSLYFDNYSDKAVFEKLSGQSRREKFRIRFYNNDPSFLRLEKKTKINQLVYKESAPLSTEICATLLAGNHECLQSQKSSLLMTELYSKMNYQCLRPRNIVSYHREAYVYPHGNVRVTLDSKISTSNNVSDFLNPNTTHIPASALDILEIKFDGFLPDVIRDIVCIDRRNQTEFSKYVTGRLV